jgi:geranylgeranyl diphosphate synthase type II
MIEDEQLLDWVDAIDTALVRYFAKKDMSCNPLDRAMEYTLLAGGKRLRPLLTLTACHALGGDANEAMPFALASELLHTYSLIHDDLPCMDDDDMRRGKPANHIIFGEANAILAGDALQAEAFTILAGSPHASLSPDRRVTIIAELAHAAGRGGMVAGQVMDLEQEGKPIDQERLELLHRRKTGALLRFCVRLGGHLAGASEPRMAALTRYAEAIGLLFQVVDDLLDAESSSEKLGKTAGKDALREKATFPALLGADAARAYAAQLRDQALKALEELQPGTDHLTTIAHFIHDREH